MRGVGEIDVVRMERVRTERTMETLGFYDERCGLFWKPSRAHTCTNTQHVGTTPLTAE